MRIGGEVPEFAAVYPVSPAGFPTPRLAAYVWAAAGMLGEVYQRSEAWPGLVADLPPIVRRLVDDEWMATFIACFDALADRVGCGGYESEQLARCTAEEMALHLILDVAEDLAKEGALSAEPWMVDLPAHGDDLDFDMARSLLFRDHDVLVLFEQSLDGVEDPDDPVGSDRGFVNLHPREWFAFFSDVSP